MPHPHPLPKKYLGILGEAQSELRCIAQRARTALEEVEADEQPFDLTRIFLRDIQAIAYRIALDLATLDIAGTCDGCPSAPPTTQAEAILLITATQLERLAVQARTQATRGGGLKTATSGQWLTEDEADAYIERSQQNTLKKLK